MEVVVFFCFFFANWDDRSIRSVKRYFGRLGCQMILGIWKIIIRLIVLQFRESSKINYRIEILLKSVSDWMSTGEICWIIFETYPLIFNVAVESKILLTVLQSSPLVLLSPPSKYPNIVIFVMKVAENLQIDWLIDWHTVYSEIGLDEWETSYYVRSI